MWARRLRDSGADDGTRTRNRRFTKPLLYQLSYVGGDAEGYRTTRRMRNDAPSAGQQVVLLGRRGLLRGRRLRGRGPRGAPFPGGRRLRGISRGVGRGGRLVALPGRRSSLARTGSL